MRTFFIIAIALISSTCYAQLAGNIDLTHWELELPTGYKAAEWKLSNFQDDPFAKPFFYVDESDQALVMVAYPAKGTSKAKYSQNRLRERIEPCDRDMNWSMKDGGELSAQFQVTEMSYNPEQKRDRTLLFQIHGTTNDDIEAQFGLSKSVSVPLISVYWQNDRIRVVRKVLKEAGANGADLVDKNAWENDGGRYFPKKIAFEKSEIKITASEGRVEVSLNGSKPIIYRDASIRKWPFDNYFVAGNYLQTKQPGSRSVVKFYKLEVTH